MDTPFKGCPYPECFANGLLLARAIDLGAIDLGAMSLVAMGLVATSDKELSC